MWQSPPPPLLNSFTYKEKDFFFILPVGKQVWLSKNSILRRVLDQDGRVGGYSAHLLPQTPKLQLHKDQLSLKMTQKPAEQIFYNSRHKGKAH